MTPTQRAFLNNVAKRIPALMEAIRLGNQRSEFILGSRHVNGRQVRLVLVAEVVDAGSNPLATHSSQSSEINQTLSQTQTEAQIKVSD